ncbi:hypothetical protein RINTHH_16020 [Richelia intracellularis HH01]|jgi:hypothetical protein|uniref:UspA domain-containing protein n=1 Tax=Richelia intracellularis HH01 TaxID=1165094 RepID=M1WZP3_9NOST|nr:hypothetical protein [Richelia intracellularis]CCH67757.1 hypothetical protein RINTHH_16020 [Richelia intracellularis HH01]
MADEVNTNLIVIGCRGLELTEESAIYSIYNRAINLSYYLVIIVP